MLYNIVSDKRALSLDMHLMGLEDVLNKLCSSYCPSHFQSACQNDLWEECTDIFIYSVHLQ